MSLTNWLQLGITLGVVFALAPVERGIYRIRGIDAKKEMNWKQYAAALLIFNALGFVTLMALLMTQKWLPLNPAKLDNMSWHLALNTAISFVTGFLISTLGSRRRFSPRGAFRWISCRGSSGSRAFL